MGSSSGSAMNVNFLFVFSSILTGSAIILYPFKPATVASISSTSKAMCLRPLPSGLDNLSGAPGNEKKPNYILAVNGQVEFI